MASQLAAPEAALRALEGHLSTTFATAIPPYGRILGSADYAAPDPAGIAAKVVVGWSDQQGEIQYPTIGLDVTPGGRRSGFYPTVVSQTEHGTPGTDPTVALLVALADLEIPIEINVWASSKFQRASVLRSLESSLRPGDGDLCLAASRYYGQSIGYSQADAPSFGDTSAGAGSNEFRASMTLIASLVEVVPMTASRLTDLQLAWAIEGPRSGKALGDAIAAGETQTVF